MFYSFIHYLLISASLHKSMEFLEVYSSSLSILKSWSSSSSSPKLAWRIYPWNLNASRRNTHFGVHLQPHQALPYFLVDSHQHRLLIHFPLFYFEDTTNIIPKIMKIVSFYLWEILIFLYLSWSWSSTCTFTSQNFFFPFFFLHEM